MRGTEMSQDDWDAERLFEGRNPSRKLRGSEVTGLPAVPHDVGHQGKSHVCSEQDCFLGSGTEVFGLLSLTLLQLCPGCNFLRTSNIPRMYGPNTVVTPATMTFPRSPFKEISLVLQVSIRLRFFLFPNGALPSTCSVFTSLEISA